MKRTKIIITLCAAFLLAGCGNKKESQVDKNEQAINYVRDNKNNISQKESQEDEIEKAITYVRANKNNHKSISKNNHVSSFHSNSSANLSHIHIFTQ